MATEIPDQSKWYIPAASLFLYLVALTLPCIEFRNGLVRVYYGYSILFMGWMVIVIGQLAWMANPAWLVSMVFFVFRKWVLSLIFSSISLLLAASTFFFFRQKALIIDPLGIQRMFDESRLRIGFYVWITSLALTGAGSIYEIVAEKRRRRNMVEDH